MKKFCLSCILIVVLFVSSLVACGKEANCSSQDRFINIEVHAGAYCVCYDRYTHVMYAMSAGCYNYGTFTLLVDSHGDPLIYRGE